MRKVLEQGLPRLGLGTELIPALEAFSRLLLEKNQVMNLTAITEPREVARLHLLDSRSLLPLAALADLRGKRVVDVGTGAGFPGVPVAIARPAVQMTLLDSLGKRVEFLRESCGALGLANAACVQARAEEFARERRESFDAALSRAVAALPILCELCLPLVKVGGRFLAMKSSHSQEEIDSAQRAIEILGGRTAWVRDYTIPGTEVAHRVVCVEKIRETPERYPRRFAVMKKQRLA